MLDQVKIIKKAYENDEISQEVPVETARNIWVDVLDVTRAEWTSAGQMGLRPAYTLRTNAMNYMGEATIELKGARFAIYRTYRIPNSDDIELYIQSEVGA